MILVKVLQNIFLTYIILSLLVKLHIFQTNMKLNYK